MAELNRRYDDIEILEIPDDDDVSVSSETEVAISENEESQKIAEDETSTNLDEGNTSVFTINNDFPELSDWISNDKPLKFQFDNKSYKKTINISDNFQKKYICYINSNYKVLEKLTKNELITDNYNDTIGLITNSSLTRKSKVIDEAFQEILENLNNLILNEQDSEIEPFQFMKFILLCLYSNNFYQNLTEKPELIKDWVNNFDPQPSQELVEEIMISNPNPYLHPQFWNTLLSKFIIRGLFDQCESVLENSNYQELENKCEDLYNAINDLKALLFDYTNFAKKGQFAQWKLLACEYRDSLTDLKNNVHDPTYRTIFMQIFDLACIITGLPKTITSFCDYWYEVYLGLSLYQIRDNEEVYQDFFETAKIEIPPIKSTSQDLEEMTEHCFIDILKGNYLKVLETLFTLDQFTAAYIAELLELKQLLRDYYLKDVKRDEELNLRSLTNSKTISEYFLTRHAFDCLNIHDLVPVAIGLLLNEVINTSKNAITNNKTTIGSFLPNFHCKTNDDLEWCLTICANLGLVSTARELYYRSGLKSLDEGYLFEALNSFVKCFDPEDVNFSLNHSNISSMKKIHYIIWELIFSNALVDNKPINDELINNIIDKQIDFEIHPVIKQSLSPYGVLKEFYDSIPREDIKLSKKLSKITHLLRFNFLPKKFYPLLLAQFVHFLKNEKYHFQLPDLILIIELIDNFETDSNEEEIEEGESLYLYSINNIKDKSEFDWRNIDKVPPNVKDLVKTLRNSIAIKIGQVFIE
ncbi:unnamed protein product [Candida verbasci]|uniref:Nuclear pore complex protein Nup85 n=1 Tax=Candida verbasci TaxID=1227364 RepID=A0A9W4XM52_9ASCO|nr:unnamed protein product [Candida verbasci]